MDLVALPWQKPLILQDLASKVVYVDTVESLFLHCYIPELIRTQRIAVSELLL
jgi:hypothetical protein